MLRLVMAMLMAVATVLPALAQDSVISLPPPSASDASDASDASSSAEPGPPPPCGGETITIARDWNAPGIQTLAGTLHFRDYGSYIEDLKRGETATVSDAYEDTRTAATADALKAISAQAFVNMPVTELGRSVALLYLNHETRREWSDDDLALIREFADRTRAAVERARSDQELRD